MPDDCPDPTFRESRRPRSLSRVQAHSTPRQTAPGGGNFMNEKRHPEILAFAVVIVSAFAATAWFPELSTQPSALEARWKRELPQTDRDNELQDAVTNWRTELARVADSVYRDAALLPPDAAAGTRLRARARELEAVQAQLASRARYPRVQAGLARVDSIEIARLAVLLADSVDQTPEASPEVARATLDRAEAFVPRATRFAHGQSEVRALLARRDVVSVVEAAP